MNYDEADDDLDELPARPRKEIPAAYRELLHLAARALGTVQVEDVEGEEWLNLHFEDGSTVFHWNPLLHGDDALALSVRLRMNIEHNHIGAAVMVNNTSREKYVDHTSDDEATRRAIVRAAAEIGKQRA